MTTLLIHRPNVPGTGTGTLFGGLPAMPRDTPFTWPTCKRCKGALQFLAQLEEGPVDETSMNFGGDGCAYVFDCSCGSNVGKIRTQCG